jgi:hypothetical protein
MGILKEMRQLHPLTEENLHIFTAEQQKKIRTMMPEREIHNRSTSQPNNKRVSIMAEHGVSMNK